jgi:hypothetical protein
VDGVAAAECVLHPRKTRVFAQQLQRLAGLAPTQELAHSLPGSPDGGAGSDGPVSFVTQVCEHAKEGGW